MAIKKSRSSTKTSKHVTKKTTASKKSQAVHHTPIHQPQHVVFPIEGEKIVFQWIKTHNLKDIDIEIPKNQIVTITGVSWSGKSSLAFDTIYKEGQYRYIESLNSYLRQFFNLGERPDIDSSSWLSPAIAIEQNKRVGNARSTVGTLTEIDDYLRLMFAKLGDIYSYGSGKIIKSQTVDQIVDEIKHLYNGKKIYLVQEAWSYQEAREFLKFVKKNRLKVENGDGFTRYLVVMKTQPDSESTSSYQNKSELETYGSNIVIDETSTSSKQTSKKKKSDAPQEPVLSTVEYFYLESPHIPDKFFPCTVYGIFDRVTIEEQKLPRLKEDIIKILAMSKKFGVYAFLNNKHDDSSQISRSFDKDVYAITDEIKRFTDKNYCPDFDITYPDFTPQHFSANRAEWACPACHGLWETLKIDIDKIIDPWSPYTKAILPWRDSLIGQTILKKLAQKYGIDEDKLWNDLPERFKVVVIEWDGELLRLGLSGKYMSLYYKGIQDILTQQYNKWILTVDFQAMFDMEPCEECHGAKLRKESMHVFLYTGKPWKQPVNFITEGREWLYGIFDLQRMPISHLITTLEEFWSNSLKPEALLKRILTPLIDRAKTIAWLWLGHLSLLRQIDTLSGGEIQRLRLAKQLWNKLTGIMYVLDEPTIWLDDDEVVRTIEAIRWLKQAGNTIVVVEHNDAFIKASDRVIEIWPWSGDFGGNVTFSWPYEEFLKSDCLTAQYVRWDKKIEITFDHRPSEQKLVVKKASQNNLKNIDVSIRIWSFSIITWPSGAGKTTLMFGTIYKFLQEKQKFIQWYIRLQLLKQWLSRNDIIAAPVMKREEYESLSNLALQEFHKHLGVETVRWFDNIDNVIYVDQSSIGKTPRSCPATFIGVFDNIRKIFAGVNEAKFLWLTAWHFSFNSSKWACPECDGYGYKKVELQFLPDTYVPCELCHGKRYKPEILSIQRRGKNISQVLDMYVSDALELFQDVSFIAEELQLMKEIWLGYLKMGQPAHTLSWGESQRIKLVKHLLKSYKGHSVYFLDEPTVGLHPSDIEKLLLVLKKFLDKWDTILMIEHDKSLLTFADEVIVLRDGHIEEHRKK